MLNIQSLIKFPIPKSVLEIKSSTDADIDKEVYNSYGLTKEEIIYIEEHI